MKYHDMSSEDLSGRPMEIGRFIPKRREENKSDGRLES